MTALPWAIYSRVSDDDQVKGVSLDVQLESGVSYLKSIGITDTIKISDDGYSAWMPNHMKRPGIVRIQQLIKEKAIAGLVVWAFDRLIRIQRDLIDFIDHLRREEIGFVCVTMRIDTTGPWGRFILQMIGSLAELESGRTSDRVKAAVKHIKAKGGFHGGNVPTGFHPEGEKGNRQLVMEPAIVAKLSPLWTMVVDGASLRDLATYLNREVKTKRGKPWAINTVADLLRNHKYIGHAVSREGFDQAAAALAGRWSPRRSSGSTAAEGTEHRGRPATRIYPLAGVAFCAHCDHALTAAYSTGRNARVYYYRCSANNRKGSAGCKAKPLPAEAWERTVYKALAKALEEPDKILAVWRARAAEQEQQVEPLGEERKRIVMEVDRATAAIERLVESLEVGGAAARAVKARLDARQTELEVARVKLGRLDARLAAAAVARANADAAVELIRLAAVERLPQASLEEQAAIVPGIIHRVIMAVDSPRIRLELLIDPPPAVGARNNTAWRSNPDRSRTDTVSIEVRVRAQPRHRWSTPDPLIGAVLGVS